MKTCLTYKAQTRKARKSAVSNVHTEIGEQKKRQAHMQHRGAAWVRVGMCSSQKATPQNGGLVSFGMIFHFSKP